MGKHGPGTPRTRMHRERMGLHVHGWPVHWGDTDSSSGFIASVKRRGGGAMLGVDEFPAGTSPPRLPTDPLPQPSMWSSQHSTPLACTWSLPRLQMPIPMSDPLAARRQTCRVPDRDSKGSSSTGTRPGRCGIAAHLIPAHCTGCARAKNVNTKNGYGAVVWRSLACDGAAPCSMHCPGAGCCRNGQNQARSGMPQVAMADARGK